MRFRQSFTASWKPPPNGDSLARYIEMKRECHRFMEFPPEVIQLKNDYVLNHIYSLSHISTIAEAEMFCDNVHFLLQSFLLINRLINTNHKTKLNGNISLVLQGKYLKRALFNGLFDWKIIICQHHQFQTKCL